MDTINSNYLNCSKDSGLLHDALNDSAQHTTYSAVPFTPRYITLPGNLFVIGNMTTSTKQTC